MSRYPQYGIFENPMDGRVFILQTRPVWLMAQVHHFIDESEYMEAKRQITIGASTEYEDEMILLQHVPMAIEHVIATQEEADKMAKMMRRMADWYLAYLKWEDEQ